MPFDDEYYYDYDTDEYYGTDNSDTYYDLDENMEKYYDFNLLDLLEDVNLDIQDLSKEELENYLRNKKGL